MADHLLKGAVMLPPESPGPPGSAAALDALALSALNVMPSA
jgi:hypothetical protein